MDVNQIFQQIQELQEQKQQKDQISTATYNEVGELMAEANKLKADAAIVSERINETKERILVAKAAENPWDEFNLQNMAAQVEVALIDKSIKNIDEEIAKINKDKSIDYANASLYKKEIERLNGLKTDLIKRKQKILTGIAELKEATKAKISENAEKISDLYEERKSEIENYQKIIEEIKTLQNEINEKKSDHIRIIEEIKKLKLTITEKKTNYERDIVENYVPEEYRENCCIIAKNSQGKIDILFGRAPYYGNDPRHGHICIDMNTGKILYYREYGKR